MPVSGRREGANHVKCMDRLPTVDRRANQSVLIGRGIVGLRNITGMTGRKMRAFRKIGAAVLAAAVLAAGVPALGVCGARAQETSESPAAARNKGTVTGLPLPRFVSLKFDNVHLRRGPGFGHRIDWDYVQRRGMPVEIIAEVDHWRRVRDIDGDEGWVHSSQLSSRRGAVVTGEAASTLRRKPDAAATAVALVEPGLIGTIKKCREGWCRIALRGYTGWLPRTVIWGLYAHEEGID